MMFWFNLYTIYTLCVIKEKWGRDYIVTTQTPDYWFGWDQKIKTGTGDHSNMVYFNKSMNTGDLTLYLIPTACIIIIIMAAYIMYHSKQKVRHIFIAEKLILRPLPTALNAKQCLVTQVQEI